MFRVSLVTAVVATVLAALAGTASAATPAAPAAPAAGAAAVAAPAPAGTLNLRLVLQKVTASGSQLTAHGEVVGTIQTATGATQVVRKPFTAPVRSLTRSTQRTNRICDILNLNLAPLRLELLGLIIELDRVVLTIRANSRGGLLGSLLCGLAGRPAAQANSLTNALKRNGISGLFATTLPLVPTNLPSPALLPPVPAGHCTVLDLVLGPLDLNLLGLMIHLDRVHLRITADPKGGILGSLLCGLAGGPLPIPVPPAP